MEQRCVYILKGDRYYVGSTNDIERRLQELVNRIMNYISKLKMEEIRGFIFLMFQRAAK